MAAHGAHADNREADGWTSTPHYTHYNYIDNHIRIHIRVHPARHTPPPPRLHLANMQRVG